MAVIWCDWRDVEEIVVKIRKMRTPRLLQEEKLKLSGEFEQLIDSESEHAEHPMRHDLAGTPHTNAGRRR